MDFNITQPKPSDRSIFRKNIGRALLNKTDNPYLETWEIDFTPKKNQILYGNLRDIEFEKSLEEEITETLRRLFSFRYIIVEDQEKRIGADGLENRLIGTVSNCGNCKPSASWLGNYSPVEIISKSGLWQTQHVWGREINENDVEEIRKVV